MKTCVGPVLLAVALGFCGRTVFAVEAPPSATDTFPSRLVRQTVKPEFPRILLQEGIVKGKVQVSANVDQKGRVTDCLVTAYTHPRFAEESVNALRQWEFAPAQIHGVPVSTVADFVFEYEVDGVVLVHETPARMFNGMSGLLKDRYVYLICPPNKLDHQVTPVRVVQPLYSKKLHDQGVKGKVVIQFYIDETGKPRLPAIAEGENDELASAAASALQQWQFEPPTSRGSPVLVYATQEFNF